MTVGKLFLHSISGGYPRIYDGSTQAMAILHWWDQILVLWRIVYILYLILWKRCSLIQFFNFLDFKETEESHSISSQFPQFQGNQNQKRFFLFISTPGTSTLLFKADIAEEYQTTIIQTLSIDLWPPIWPPDEKTQLFQNWAICRRNKRGSPIHMAVRKGKSGLIGKGSLP